MSDDSWENVDWARLDRLRSFFLDSRLIEGPYWRDEADLQAYDLTFAARIGWKWDAVLRGLLQYAWQPGSSRIYDWGCGTGMAVRRLLAAFPDHPWTQVDLWDHSLLATDFARRQITETHPALECRITPPDRLEPGSIVLVSHALGEADEESLRILWEKVREADGVLIVEPGTFADSRGLVAVREALKDKFTVVAPCTHAETCGLLTEENSRHWCHHFGHVPTEVFMDSNWARFARTMGIDLRSIPYSYLVLDKSGAQVASDGTSRVLGKPRFYKGFCRILSCQASGVTEYELQKRTDKHLWKTLKKGRHGGLFGWTTEGGRIVAGAESAGEG